MIAAFNYSNEYRKYEDMQNNLYGVYDADKDQSNYLRYSVDDQYNTTCDWEPCSTSPYFLPTATASIS